MSLFRALVVDKDKDNVSVSINQLSLDDLPEGNVVIRVEYSSVNYKDGLASIPNGKIVTSYPFIPGIDLAGVIVSSGDPNFREGDQVIITGYGLGVSHFGGFSEYARVPSEWVVPLPHGLSLKEAMVIGTAGFTAALSVQALEDNGLSQDATTLVTGATGGVGSMAVAMLAKRGYNVVANTGKKTEVPYLHELGANEVILREDLVPDKVRALGKQLWDGVVDPVGGNSLSHILSTTKYGGTVAVSGNTGGINFSSTIFPFILRNVRLVGIDSVYYPMEKRLNLWKRLANDLKPNNLLDNIATEITFEQLPERLSDILKSQIRGRTIVRVRDN